MPELRKDPITNRWVIIATERAKRPSDFIHGDEKASGNNTASCPLCPGNEKMTPPEITAYREPGTMPNEPGWWVRVVPNKFPALESEGELQKAGLGIYDMMSGIGSHEVIIDSPDHHTPTCMLSQKQIEEFLWVYRDRLLALNSDPRLRYILIFKNYGKAAGASLEHPHSQLIATPIVPKRVMEEVEGSRIFYNLKERCIFCDILKQELAMGDRIVEVNNSFVAFEPYASRFPFETIIAPKKHDASYAFIDKNQIMDLANILKSTLWKIHVVLNDPPFNFVLHTAPLSDGVKSFYHWHIEIMPRLTQVAGFEWGSGMYINPTPPETAAKELQKGGTPDALQIPKTY
jgi:UDPglucose--hexose-1-phosphate uridylyltransferase